ncbi:hypothetical protein [Thalassospira marina]|nr:hypothetical protein [Thalassospira marina]
MTPPDMAESPDRQPPAIVMPDRPMMADDWSDGLPVIYNQVAGCLNADPSPPARVVDAGQGNDGQIVIDMMGDSGTYFRCQTDPAGKSKPVLFRQEMPANLPGPVYTATPYPPPKSPQAGICYEHYPVTDHTGWQLGWLSYARAGDNCSTASIAKP